MITFGLLAAGVVAIIALYVSALYHANKLVKLANSFHRNYVVSPGSVEPKRTLIFLGDSLFAGVGASSKVATLPCQIALRYPAKPVRVINAARSKARARDLASQLEGIGTTIDGSVTVYILIGGNDVIHGTPLGAFEHDIMATVASLDKQGARVVLATAPNLSFIPAFLGLGRLLARRTKRFNLTVRTVAETFPNVTLVDIHSVKLVDSHHYAPDGFHASDIGYELWAKCYDNPP